jgi:hypothetical protein
LKAPGFAPGLFFLLFDFKSQATKDFTTMTDLEAIARDKREYLLAELRAAALRARLWQADIDAVGLALKAGLISSDQAVEHLADCGVLCLVGLREEHGAAA